MFLIGWVADWPDAMNFLQLFYSKNGSPGPNRVNYADPAYDALYASSYDKKNVAYLGRGMVFNKFTGSRGKSGASEANAEFVGKLRAILDKHNVHYQFSELGKVDLGGGGTIAHIMAVYGMEVIDSGVAVLSMHAPWEAVSKVDVYETKNGYVAFLKEI